MKTAREIKEQSAADANVLSIYLKEINKIPLMTREEEDQYARLAAQGDKLAKEKLVKANLRFVVNVAKKYQNQGLPLADLISEGNIGLLHAIERFDVSKGYHFISYAVWWIRQAILKAICEKSRPIRLPLNRANELVQIEKAKKIINESMSEDDEEHEIARMLNMEPSHVRDLVTVSRDFVSLDAPIYDDRESGSLVDMVDSSAYKGPEDTIIELALRDDINRVLKTLTEKERKIIEMRFGLNNHKPLSLKEIGEEFNLTKERIRQIEKAVLKRLSDSYDASMLESYVA